MISKAKRRTAERLARRRFRKREGLTLAEGPRVVREALRSSARGLWVAAGEEFAGTAEGWAIVERFAEKGVETVVAPDRDVAALCTTESPQPVVMVVRAEPLQPRPFDPGGRYLIADGVQNPGNLGTLVRSAWGFGLDGIAVGEGSADIWNPKVVRASAGAVFRVRLASVPPGYPASGGRTPELLFADSAGVSADTVVPDEGGWALVVGNETRGVSERYRLAGRGVAVPMASGVDSLNAAVAGSVLMYIFASAAR